MEIFIGWLAVVSSIMLTCIGLPAQIRKNYSKRSAAGLSVGWMSISFITFVIWAVYGFVKTPADLFIVSANLPGAVFTGVILIQIFRYRETN